MTAFDAFVLATWIFYELSPRHSQLVTGYGKNEWMPCNRKPVGSIPANENSFLCDPVTLNGLEMHLSDKKEKVS